MKNLITTLATLVSIPHSQNFHIKPISKNEFSIRINNERYVIKVNNEYEIPYLAGYSLDGRTVYIDKRLPRYYKFKNGQTVAVFKYLVSHEVFEKFLELFGYKYDYRHLKATGMERSMVCRDNIDWDEYQDFMLSMVQKLKKFSGPLPLDLDLSPERDSHDNYRYQKIKKIQKQEIQEKSKQKKQEKKEKQEKQEKKEVKKDGN